MDGTFIYDDSQVLIAVPLLEEIDSPWLAKSDEEEWEEDAGKEDDEEADEASEDEDKNGGAADEASDDNGNDENGDSKEDNGDKPAPPADDITGTWEGVAQTPEGELPFTMTLKLHPDGSVTGSLSSQAYSGEINH